MTNMRCDAPACGEASAGSRPVADDDRRVRVELCERHLAIVDSELRTTRNEAFWNWMRGRAPRRLG